MAEERGAEYDSQRKAYKWVFVTLGISFTSLVLLAVLAFPLQVIVRDGISSDSLRTVGSYFGTIVARPGQVFAEYRAWVVRMYRGPEQAYAEATAEYQASGQQFAQIAFATGLFRDVNGAATYVWQTVHQRGPRSIREMIATDPAYTDQLLLAGNPGANVGAEELRQASLRLRAVPQFMAALDSLARHAGRVRSASAAGGAAEWLPALPLPVFVILLVGGLLTNPHSFLVQIHGSGRLAKDEDIEKMKLFNGFIMVLGRWKGRYLKMPETLSCLVVAPPGTGKTVGVVIPTILHSDGISLIVNDPKPELAAITSGYRSTQGPCFVLAWGEVDNPARGIYYPRWNPLSPKCLPPPGPEREMYVDGMVGVFVEDPKGGADPHWTKTGRSALSAMVLFIADKIERAQANDYFVHQLRTGAFDDQDYDLLERYYLDNMQHPDVPFALDRVRKRQITLDTYTAVGTWANIPKRWLGAEPCVAMIIDWLTEAQFAAAEEIKRRTEEGDQMASLADPMKDMLEGAVMEARHYGYSVRAMNDLTQLANTPDKERGSILSTALTGIAIFKNDAVRQRTRTSDFGFTDIRGMRDPADGKLKPVTIYLAVDQTDAKAMGPITGAFVELLSGFLIKAPPHKEIDGITMGPYPALFVLDEFPQMPKLEAVLNGPAVGRGQKVSYLLVGQDLGQISGQYGKDELETVITTTAAKVILPQNNEQTAERFSKMIGNRTVEIKSTSRTEGLSSNVNIMSANVSRQIQSAAVLRPGQLLSLEKGKQVVLFQGYYNRPIMADAPYFFQDKEMLARTKIPPAPPMPDWVRLSRDTDGRAPDPVLPGELGGGGTGAIGGGGGVAAGMQQGLAQSAGR